MNIVGDRERKTQNRVVNLFRDQLKYEYLGNWEDRPDTSNIQEELLTRYLQSTEQYSNSLISEAIYVLSKTADNCSEGLYTVNKQVYSLLRYGVNVKESAGDNNETVKLIDWQNPIRIPLPLQKK